MLLRILVMSVYSLLHTMYKTSHDKFINDYLEFLLDMRWLAQGTIDARRIHLTSFFEFNKTIQLADISISDIRDYLNFLKDRDRWFHSRHSHAWKGKLSLLTIQWYMSTVRHFYKRSNAMEYTKWIHPSLIQSPKVQRRKIQALSDEDLTKILHAPLIMEERKDVMYRNFLLILVWYLLWLRIGEALSLTFDDVLNPNQLVTIQWKWRHERCLHIPDIVQAVALEYQKMRWGSVFVNRKNKRYWPDYVYTKTVIDQQPDLIFTCLDRVNYGKPLKRQSTSNFFRVYEKYMKISERITYHRLRHTFGKHLLNNKVNIYTLQQLLWHQTILATQHYVTANEDTIKHAQSTLLPKIQLTGSINGELLKRLEL